MAQFMILDNDRLHYTGCIESSELVHHATMENMWTEKGRFFPLCQNYTRLRYYLETGKLPMLSASTGQIDTCVIVSHDGYMHKITSFGRGKRLALDTIPYKIGVGHRVIISDSLVVEQTGSLLLAEKLPVDEVIAELKASYPTTENTFKSINLNAVVSELKRRKLTKDIFED